MFSRPTIQQTQMKCKCRDACLHLRRRPDQIRLRDTRLHPLPAHRKATPQHTQPPTKPSRQRPRILPREHRQRPRAALPPPRGHPGRRRRTCRFLNRRNSGHGRQGRRRVTSTTGTHDRRPVEKGGLPPTQPLLVVGGVGVDLHVEVLLDIIEDGGHATDEPGSWA